MVIILFKSILELLKVIAMIKIKEIRMLRGLSQIRLAELLSVEPATINRYEKGTRECSYDVLVRLADILQVSVDQLLGRKIVPMAPALGNLSEEEYSLILKYRELDESHKAIISSVLATTATNLTNVENEIKPEKTTIEKHKKVM